MTFSDSIPKSSSQAIGLHWLIEKLGLDVVSPAVRSEVVRGARKTRIANGEVLEQYPLSYAPRDARFPAGSAHSPKSRHTIREKATVATGPG
jgi:hypothetical protein